MEFFFKHKRWLWPLLFLIILAPFTPSWDLKIENYFYTHSNDLSTHFMTSPFIEFMYNWGFWIPNLFAIFCLVLLFFKSWRKPALVVVLTLIVGSGLVVHGILKDHWGRARPKQIEEFGGTQPFHPFWKPGAETTEPCKSFACGHGSTGFLFLTLVILGRRLHAKPMFWAGVLLTFLMGGGLSYARLAQGGHFLTDALVAALIMWWTALCMDWLVYADENAN